MEPKTTLYMIKAHEIDPYSKYEIVDWGWGWGVFSICFREYPIG